MVHTPSLWISEGLTSYYGLLALERSGLITPEQYLAEIGKLITKFEAYPGRAERSIEDTSWDTWYRGTIKQANNLENTTYSYYDGGQVMGHILDFAIRHATSNQKSLEDWMRLMYSRYALPEPGFLPQDAIRAASEVAGNDLTDTFRRYIGGKEAIPYDQFFTYAGIAVKKESSPEEPWVGISVSSGSDGRVKIQNILPGSPAELAGLDRDDVILAVDNRAIESASFAKAMKNRKPGDTIHVTVIRLGRLQEFSVTLKSNPHFTYRLQPMENASAQQKAIYDSWLGIKSEK
jgi:predicted metalloprotease with PDZ domain